MTSRLGRVLVSFTVASALCSAAPALAAAAPQRATLFVNGVARQANSAAARHRYGVHWFIALSPAKVVGYASHASYLRALRRPARVNSNRAVARMSSAPAAYFYQDIYGGGCAMALGYGGRASDLRGWYRCGLGNWNDQFSSIDTRGIGSYYTLVYSDINYGGSSVALNPGYAFNDLRSLGFQPWNINDQVSSVKVCPC